MAKAWNKYGALGADEWWACKVCTAHLTIAVGYKGTSGEAKFCAGCHEHKETAHLCALKDLPNKIRWKLEHPELAWQQVPFKSRKGKGKTAAVERGLVFGNQPYLQQQAWNNGNGTGKENWGGTPMGFVPGFQGYYNLNEKANGKGQ